MYRGHAKMMTSAEREGVCKRRRLTMGEGVCQCIMQMHVLVFICKRSILRGTEGQKIAEFCGCPSYGCSLFRQLSHSRLHINLLINLLLSQQLKFPSVDLFYTWLKHHYLLGLQHCARPSALQLSCILSSLKGVF